MLKIILIKQEIQNQTHSLIILFIQQTMEPQLSNYKDQHNLYQYCYIQNDPFSLTVTKQPKIIYEELYKEATHIWIVPNGIKLKLQPQQISIRAELNINFMNTIEDLQQHYRHQNQNIALICHVSLQSEVETVLKPMFLADKIKNIVFYGINKNVKQQQLKYEYVSYADNEQTAIIQIRSNKKEYAENFVNFICYDKQKQTSNILVRTMFAMIRKSTNAYQIMKQFKQLSISCYQMLTEDIENFTQLYEENNHLAENEAVRWYAGQTFLYRLVNQILRISKDPTCLFIIQPYFLDLFHNIRNLYEKQQLQGDYLIGTDKKSYKQFTCYRGTIISVNEIKFFKQNINSLIQNLGFMSTSRSRKIALNFVKNALFIISVQNIERKYELDYGFADIYEYNPQLEEQILFNPLNSFQIVSFEQQSENQKYYKITLKYGQMGRISAAAGKNGKFNQKQRNYLYLGEYQIQESIRCENMGNVLIQKTYHLQASEQYCDKFMEIAIDSQQLDALNVAHCFNALLAQHKGDFKTAKNQYIICLEINKQRLRVGHQDQKQINIHLARSLNNLGTFCISLGQYYEAVEYLQMCQKIQKQTFGESHSDYPTILSNLGLSFMHLCQYQKAMEYLQRCEKIRRQTLGENHPDYAKTLSYLGDFFKSLGQYQKAMDCYQKCEKIQKQTLGQNHPSYAKTLGSLGLTFDNLGQHQIALNHQIKCQKILRQILGQNHPQYAKVLFILGSTFQNMGQNDRAVENYQRCEKIRKQTLGENHPQYVKVLLILGSTFQSIDQNQKALEYLQRCEKIRKQTIGENNLDYGIILKNLGVIFDKMGHHQKALEYFRKCKKIQRQKIGQNHPDYANTLNNLGITFDKMGKHKKALKKFKRCEKIRRQTLGQNNLIYADTLSNLGLYFDRLGQYQQALGYYRRSLKIRRQILQENHQQQKITPIGNNQQNIYSAKMSKDEKSISYLNKLYKIQKNITQKLNKQHKQKKQLNKSKEIKKQKQDEIIISYYLLDYQELANPVSRKQLKILIMQIQNFWLTSKLL